MVAKQTKRNVLFMIADDWSWFANYYGRPGPKMPHVDEAASRGTAFLNGFCATPTCAASRACLLTGRYSHSHGMYGLSHSPHGFECHDRETSSVKILRESGYATACIGKNHTRPASVFPFEFEPSVDPRSPHDMADAARGIFSEIGDRPFYMHVGFVDPHRGQGKSGFDNERGYRDYTEITYDPNEIQVPDFFEDNPETRQDLAHYFQALSRLDAGYGAVMKALEETGKAEDTLVFVTTDHGMPFPGCKAAPFDTGHSTPLIAINPDLGGKSVVSKAMMCWVDIMPTVLEWCGLEIPQNVHGKSFLGTLGQEDPQGWDEVFLSHGLHCITDYYPWRILRGKKYKYVLNIAHQLPMPISNDIFLSPTWQSIIGKGKKKMGGRSVERILHHPREGLYDIEKDPLETVNLADKPEHSKIFHEMRDKVHRWRVDTEDPWLHVDVMQGYLKDPRLP